MVMIQTGVTIVRGKESQGYPFLDDRPGTIDLVSMTVRNKPATVKNTETDTRYYCADEQLDITMRIRLMLHAMIHSGFTAMVLSPIGCGFENHPP